MATRATRLEVGERLRYPKPPRPELAALDGMRNFYCVTQLAGSAMVQLEAGINAVKEIKTAGGRLRRPAVLIRSSPHKAGTPWTPWHDSIEMGRSAVYWGDRKPEHLGAPADTTGNKALLSIARLHAGLSRNDRLAAPPLLVFRGIPWRDDRGQVKEKGCVEFCGVGLVEDFDLREQVDETTGSSFENFRFALRLLPLAGAELDWRWIDDRRSAAADGEAALRAPYAWRQWIELGR